MTKRHTTTTLTAIQQLDALCWAANKAGMSYGQFSSQMTAEERDRVFMRYEKLLNEREAEKLRNESQRKKRIGNGRGKQA